MKGKTKTILTIVIAIVIVAIAAVGTVTFLKDNGEAEAAEESTKNQVLPVTGTDDEQTSTEGEQNPTENLNGEENPAEQPTGGENENPAEGTTGENTQGTTETGNQGTTENQGTTTGGQTQTEPETTTIEQERLVSTTLNWTNISLNSTIGRTGINYKNLGYTIKYYQVVDEKEINLLNTETGKAEYATKVTVTEEQIKDNCPTGYKLDEENSELSTTITENVNGNVVEVYYIKDESQTHDITYTVKHYVDGVYQDKDDFTETKTVWINDTTIPVTYTVNANKYVGYKPSTNDLEETATDGKVFNVYYVKDESQTHDITYTVKHYVDGVYQDKDDFTETKTVWINDTTIPVTYTINANKYVGYKPSTNDLEETATNGKVFNVYYVKDESQTHDITYTVKHYVDGVYQDKDDFTETKTVWINDTTIPVTYTINANKYVGYKPSTNDLEETATNGKVFNVYYVKDESQTHDITYTVKHHVDGVYKDKDDFTETKTVWINDTTIPVTYTINANKYVGYKPSTNDLEETATDGKVFNVYYVKDESQTHDITYTVKHYVDGVYQDKDDFTETKTVWINDTTIPVTYTINANKYVGYKPSTNDLEETATDGKVFNVYYVKDESQTHDITYTVKHYVDGVYQDKDDFTATKTVWINDTTIPVTYTVNANKYVGYKPSTNDLEETATDGKVFNVYYVKDESQTHDITYTVKHYVDGVYQDKDDFTETKTVWINDTTIPVTYTVNANKYVGYKPSTNDLEATATNGKVFNVYYVKDESQTHDITYTVKHYVDGVYQDKDDFTETKTVWINDTTIPVTYTVNANKYVGYKPSTNDLEATATNGKVFNVYYVKDEDQTKTITYTVKHYIEGTHQEGDDFTETKTVWVNDTTIPVTYTVNANKYVGYKLSGNDLTAKAANETVFSVYYVKDQFNYIVKYFYEGVDGEYREDNTYIPTPISADYETVITTFEPRTLNDNYVLNHVNPADEDGNAHLVISTNETANVLEVYYERNSFEYKVEYYKDSLNGEKLGTSDVKEQKVKTVMTAELVAADFGENWLNSYKPTIGYQDGEVVEYITIQANDNNVIQVVYKPQTDIPYTVEYYFNEVIDDTKTETTGRASFGDKIETVTDYSNNGEWEVDETKSTVLPFTIGATGNVIKVYYVKPDITIVKTGTVNTNRTTGAENTVEPGETITYTITATNNGYKEGTVNIGDTIPEGTTLTEGTNIVATGYDTVTVEQLEKGINLTVPARTANRAGTASVIFTVTVTAKPGNDVVNIPDVNGEQDEDNTVTNPIEKTISVKAKSETITNSNIVIVIDTSLSMSYVRCDSDWCRSRSHEHMWLTDNSGEHLYHKDETMINAAKQVTNEFIDKVNLSNDASNLESTVAVIQFDGSTADVGTATLASEKEALKRKVSSMQTHSSTNMSTALTAAKNKFASLKAGNNNIVIFLSDGEPTDSRSSVSTAATALKGVATVYTVGFGSGADTNILQNIIASSTDKYFPAADGNYSSLASAFKQASESMSNFEPEQSSEGVIALTGVYADATHPIKITVNGTPLDNITSLPTDKSGYVILDNGNYYLDLSKFNATDTVTIEYYAN